MSTLINIMPASIDPTLARRVEAATGEDGAESIRDAQAEVRDLRAEPAFGAALVRAKALCDDRRLAAAVLLKRHGELCACELQGALGITHATVSHHMACLGKAGLVETERRGRWAYYRLAPGAEVHLP